ncbi:MAG: hypothetical protein K0Q68_1480 [Moraxellaceae bacterium]|jgi:hypothetical protein|nr:hypothetical protein [Moraxellaceae bacterium]
MKTEQLMLKSLSRGFAVLAFALYTAAASAATAVAPVTGFLLETDTSAPELATAVAVFEDVVLPSDEATLIFPYSFVGALATNTLTVSFTTTEDGEVFLDLLSELTATTEDKLDYLVFDSAAVAGKTGTLKVTLANTGIDTAATSELFLAEVGETRDASSEVFTLAPLAVGSGGSGGGSSGGAFGLFAALSLLLVAGVRMKRSRR